MWEISHFKIMKKLLGICAAGALSAVSASAADLNMFAYRSFKPSFAEMKTFAEYGVNTVAIFPANTYNAKGDPYCDYPPNWLYYDKYDFSVVDRQIEDVLAVNKNADFIFIVDLNSPLWLYHHLATWNYSIESDSYTMLSNTLANKRWKTATKNYLKALLEHVEKKYPKKVGAYLLACGMTDEWMDYSGYSAGKSKIAMYKEWLAKRGKPAAEVPNINEYQKASFENFLRDPQKEGNLVDFAQFSAELVAGGVDEFAALARSVVAPDKKIGVFFGYIMQLGRGRMVSSGHLSYEKLFASPNIDSFQSPGNYYDRKMGEGSGFMCADGTRKTFGKGWLHEIDHFTIMCDPKVNKRIPFKGTPGDDAMWKTSEASVAGLKREISLCVVNGASMWFFDMWGGFFDTREMMSTIKKGHEIWLDSIKSKANPVAEIAVVADPQSAYYVNDSDPRTNKLFIETRTKANKIGAPFEVISFDDIARTDVSKYRFFVFPASFKIDAQRLKTLEEKVFKDGKTSLFMYAPAIIDGEKLDARLVKKFTGFDYGTRGINVSDRKNHKIVYIHSYDDLTVDVLRSLAEKAGVKMYASEGIPVYANDRYVAVHTAVGGVKKVSLPFKCARVVEKFTRKIVCENADSFEYNFSTPDTALFEMQR